MKAVIKMKMISFNNGAKDSGLEVICDDLKYSYGLKISLYYQNKLVNQWEISSHEEDHVDQINSLESYLHGYLEALEMLKSEVV